MADDRSESTAIPVLLMPVVAAALVDADGRVLLQRRPPGKRWPTVGVSRRQGRARRDARGGAGPRTGGGARHRASTAAAWRPLTFASAPLGERHLLLLLYVIRKWSGVPRALEASALAWVRPAEMHALPMPPADVPLGLRRC